MDPINQKAGGSNKWLYIAIGVLVLILIVVLLKNQFGVTRKINVGGYSAEVTQKMDGSTTYKSDYGTTTVNSNTWPDTWPSDVPKYADATITTAGSTNAQAGVEGVEAMFTTSDNVQTVLNFYKQGLTSNGWTSQFPGKAITGTQVGGMTGITAKKDKRSITIAITDTGTGQSKVTIMVVTMPDIKTGL